MIRNVKITIVACEDPVNERIESMKFNSASTYLQQA